jgi:osmotically inducible protein OsmC
MEALLRILYTAEVTSTGDGRSGHVASSDGIIDVPVATPKEMGGNGGATNPEQLFAAGYAACFHGALKLVGRREKVSVDGTTVTAQVGLGADDSGGFGIAVTLSVTVPGVDHDAAVRLVEAAHQVCPYSNATRGNVDVRLEVR